MKPDKQYIKEQLRRLPRVDMENILLKLSAKKEIRDFLFLNYFNEEHAESILFDECCEEIDALQTKLYKGRTLQHQQVKRMNASLKLIAGFALVVKNKKLEADLLLYLLHIQFSSCKHLFGSTTSGFDFKVAVILKRFISLLKSKVHPDYILDYQLKTNEFLAAIHKSSDRIPSIARLPKTLEEFMGN